MFEPVFLMSFATFATFGLFVVFFYVPKGQQKIFSWETVIFLGKTHIYSSESCTNANINLKISKRLTIKGQQVPSTKEKYSLLYMYFRQNIFLYFCLSYIHLHFWKERKALFTFCLRWFNAFHLSTLRPNRKQCIKKERKKAYKNKNK